MRNKIAKLLVFGGLVAGFATCASANTIWECNATFKYNSLSNTATGTFELNSSLQLVNNWDITVKGTNTPADNVYTPSDSFPVFPDLTHLDFPIGTFELNSSLQLVNNWDITVKGTNTPADNVYTPSDSFPVFPDLTHLDF